MKNTSQFCRDISVILFRSFSNLFKNITNKIIRKIFLVRIFCNIFFNHIYFYRKKSHEALVIFNVNIFLNGKQTFIQDFIRLFMNLYKKNLRKHTFQNNSS